MFLSVKDLELRKAHIDVAFPPGRLDFADRRVRPSGSISVRGAAELLASIEEIRVSGRIEGQLTADCDRCLEETVLPVSGDFDLYYRPAVSTFGMPSEAVPEDDSEIGYYEGDGIELADIVREQVLLWLPMQRLCGPDCRGICPVCGQNRNRTDCACRVEPGDDRWSALVDLKREG